MPTFAVLSSVADEDALAAWAEATYALAAPVTCRFERRSMSDAYRVESGGDAFYLKVYSPGRHGPEAIEAEIRFLLDLRERDVRVVEPLAKVDGGYTTALGMPEGPRQAALFRALPNAEVHEDDAGHSAAFGELMAQIHAVGDEAGDRYARWSLDEQQLIHDSVELLAPHMAHRPDDAAFLRSAGNELADELCGLLVKTGPFYGICHGDAHAGNARLADDGRPVLFDFDSCGYGWRALDIGAYVVSYDWMDLSAEMKRKKERIVD
ncbi:phosphotransferase, partial [Candidatus Poribacteria bacterium]|nr:phosphotransferase [Candidatus Poribacteria bacterium]